MFEFLQKTTREPVVEVKEKTSWLARLKQGLMKTRTAFSDKMAALLGKKELNAATVSEIETLLLTADVGVNMTQELIAGLRQQLSHAQLRDTEAVWSYLKDTMRTLLVQCEQPLVIEPKKNPFVILVVGINGAGKTTTIAKLAVQLQQQQYRLILAAGDTFRAAGVEQLQLWGERQRIPVIAQQTGADAAAIIYDAMTAAKARHMDVLIADTAGRLHTQIGLMHELQKIKRVLQKLDATAPHEVLLVLDASIGQNTLNQVQQFHDALGVTGLVLTKLDGTAKGGIVFALAKHAKLPIRYLGIGEQVVDLKPFNADEFIAALFD